MLYVIMWEKYLILSNIKPLYLFPPLTQETLSKVQSVSTYELIFLSA